MWVVALAACVQPPEPATDPIAEVELPGCAGQHDDPIDEYAYVVDTMGRVMRQVNPRSCTVGATIGLGSHPIAAAVTGSGNWIYVGDDEDLTLTAISQPRDEVDAVIQLPFPPTELLFEPAHTVLWATDPVSGAAALIESEHHTLVDELTLPAGFTVLASTDAAPQTMVVGHPDGFLQIIELALRTELARIELGGPPLAVGYASNIERSYVCIGGDQPELAVIPATGPSAWIVTRRIELDAPCTGIRFNGYPVGVAIQAERDTALIVDTITDTIAAEIPIGDTPDVVVLNGTMAAIGNLGSGDVSVVSLDEQAEIARTSLGGGGVGRWVQDGLDANFVYAHDADDQSLTVIDLRDGASRPPVDVGEVGEMVVAGPRGGKCH
ncbi:MAG TPA: hypothetical protein ENK18_19265 [Deltaproteobacteria bacterium]|nr:hypothetical protein [Deltaproteobacteria bacterium]